MTKFQFYASIFIPIILFSIMGVLDPGTPVLVMSLVVTIISLLIFYWAGKL